ncbi:MAG: hypothetical protein K8U57_02110 [Planctomycetes bacterium]|nr:hypothetical protein [Planctomycetota bacterium]
MSASCCGSDRKTALLISVSALLVIAVVGWVREANKEPRTVEQPVEVVAVLVATKDLTTGTAFTKDNVDELTQITFIPRASVPPDAKLIKTKDELIGKRLGREFREGEFFNVADIATRSIGPFLAGKDIMSLPFPVRGNGFIGPGSRIDILGSYIEGNRREMFTLLPDLDVLAVNGITDRGPAGQFPDMGVVSFAVDEREAKLIALANHLNCRLEILLRHPDAPKRDYDFDKTLALLQSFQKQQEELKLEVAPMPRAKSVS